MKSRCVAIIGGGCSGVLLALQLLRHSRGTPLELLIIEKSPVLGRGLAYRVPSDRCKLNVPAHSMGAFPEDPGGFLSWLLANNQQVHADDFVSRQLFGGYLADLLTHHRSNTQGVRVTHICDEACDLSYNSDTEAFQITLATHPSCVVDTCVLALGNMARNSLNNMATAEVFASPYDPESYSGIHRHKELLIVGTGLTAVDCVLEAEGRGFTGRYTMVSRHGRLPLPHEPHVPPTSSREDHLLSDGSKIGSCSLREITRLVTKESRRMGSSQPSIAALRPHLQEIWRHFSAADKKRFLRHVRPLWEIHRHRIPQAHFEHLQHLIQSKRLAIHAGKLLGAARSSRGVTIQVTPSLPEHQRLFDVAMLCAGPESDLAKIPMPLVRNLLNRGILARGELGLGAHPVQSSLPQSGQRRLKILGPMQRESLWEITAVRELRLEAEKLAREILLIQ